MKKDELRKRKKLRRRGPASEKCVGNLYMFDSCAPREALGRALKKKMKQRCRAISEASFENGGDMCSDTRAPKRKRFGPKGSSPFLGVSQVKNSWCKGAGPKTS
jgi:hypothetical protein